MDAGAVMDTAQLVTLAREVLARGAPLRLAVLFGSGAAGIN